MKISSAQLANAFAIDVGYIPDMRVLAGCPALPASGTCLVVACECPVLMVAVRILSRRVALLTSSLCDGGLRLARAHNA